MNIEGLVEIKLRNSKTFHEAIEKIQFVFQFFSIDGIQVRIMGGVTRQNYFSLVLNLHGDLIFRKYCF